MKKVLTLSLLALALGLGACGQKSGPSLKAGRNGMGGANGGQNYVTSQLPTQGYWSSINNWQYQDVVNYVSTGVPQAMVGLSPNGGNCSTNNGSGVPCQVIMNISVNPSGGTYSPLALQLANGSQTQFVETGDAVFTVAVYDSYTGAGVSAIAAPSIIIPGSGMMTYDPNNPQNNGASFQFTSGYAQYNVTGTIQGQLYNGTVTYNIPAGNSLNTSGPLQGTLGSFSTNVCYIFQCNNGSY